MFTYESMKRVIAFAMTGLMVVVMFSPLKAWTEESVVSEKNESDTVFHFDLPKASAAKNLERFGKIVERPVIFMADQVEGVVFKELKGELTLIEAMQKLVLGTRLTISEYKKTGALIVKVVPEVSDSQLGVSSKKKSEYNSNETENMKSNAKSIVKTIVSAITFGLIAGQTNLHAQSTGSISGRVSDVNYSEYLEGVTVRLEGESMVTSTDRFGEYEFSYVPAGDQTLTFYYVGYERVTQSVTVVADQTATSDVEMGQRIVELDTYTVTARQEVGQARAINQQKTAEGIVNIVSEEVFGSMVDGNVGLALQRMPGISVNESQDGSQGSINIRGISGEYNAVQIDGNTVPSSGSSRSFNPRQLSADGVTNIEIVKAPTPDRDGDAIGGIVNLVSRSAFQREGREQKLSLGATYNDLSENWGHSAKYQFTDLFSVGEGEQNLGVSFTLSAYETDRYSENADQDWVRVTPELNPELDLGQYDEPVWFMESTHFEHATKTTKTYTISGSIDYRTDDYNSFYVRPTYSYFDRTGVSYETDMDIDTRFKDKDEDRHTYAVLTPNYGLATEDSEGSRGWIGTLENSHNTLVSLAMGGLHERDSSKLSYDIFYSKNERITDDDTELNMKMEPEEPYFVMEYTIYDPNGDVDVDIVNGVDPTDLSLMTEGELELVSEEKTEKVLSARVDWEKTVDLTNGVFKFKTGAKYRKSDQTNDEFVDLYEMDEDFSYASVLEATDATLFMKEKYFNALPQNGIDLFNSNPELFEFVEDDSLEDSYVADYEAEEKTTAAYAMGTYEFGRHTIIAGIRWEKVDWKSDNYIASYLNDEATVTPVSYGNDYSFWLPGLHLRHELSENLILRESYNRSYGRPRLKELSMGRWVDDDGNIEEGNPNLEPAVSDNFDAQLEYYTDQGGLYSVGFFYKDISDFTYTEVYEFDELDSNGTPIRTEDGDLEYERPVNGAGATNYGLELILRQRLHFLPGPLSGLSAAVSATFTESEAEYPNRDDDRVLPLEGFSSELYTFTLEYSAGDFFARLDYHYRDDYIEGLGDDIESDEFYAGEYRLDAEVSYQLADGLHIFANGSNITGEPQISYQGYERFVEDASFAGAKYTFGIEYKF